MSFQNIVSTIKSALLFAGITPETGKLSYRVLIMAVTSVVLIGNASFYVILEWRNINHRISGLKAIFHYSFCCMYIMVLLCDWDNAVLLLKAIENMHYQYPFSFTVQREKLLKIRHKSMIRVSQIWYILMVANFLVSATLPIIYLAITAWRESDQNINTKDLLLMFPVYYPKHYQTFSSFLLAYMFQTTFFVFGSTFGYVTLCSTFISLKNVESELELLCLSLNEMDETISERCKDIQGRYSIHNIWDVANVDNEKMEIMKSFVTYVVKHHQSIYRKVSDVSKGIQKYAFILNGVFSTYMCMSIYFLVKEKTERMYLIQAAFFGFMFLSHLFCDDYYGEMVMTADENLRNALYSCTWTDKPNWFKKYFHISMIRTNRRIEIKPAGLFVLSLKHFAVCVNATYSYYNILKNM